MLRTVLIAGLMLSGMAGQASAAVLDGRWSVLIVTEKGDCDRAYRYEINVADGRIKYVGEGSFDFTGTVAGNGAVKVSVAKAGQHASGSGRLNGSAGTGAWSGADPSGACGGRWEAERR
ncbi:MAG: hypothetical protein ACR2K5_02435 [Pseudolabrys sp.]